MKDYCENCEAGLKRIEELEGKLAKANEDWQIRNNEACYAESRVKELEAIIQGMTIWLEINQRDVFSRGIHDAINQAKKIQLDGNG